MPRRDQYPGPAAALGRYLDAIAEVPGVERKGAANPYTSRNGHMFSFLDREGSMALRLSDDDAAEFLGRYDSGPVTAYGKTMRGYVRVPDELLADPTEIAPWIGRSHGWIGSLPPKPTRREATRTTGGRS